MGSWWFKSLAVSGRPWSTHNAENIDAVHSQEYRPYSHRFVRQVARETHFSLICNNIIKKDVQIGLNFMSYFYFFSTVLYDKKWSFLHKHYFAR